MRILNLPRAGGKTRRLVDWAKTASWTSGPVPTRVILVATYPSVRYIESLDANVRVITPRQLTSLRGLKDVEIAIDELDEVVSRLVGFPVVVATRTGLPDEH